MWRVIEAEDANALWGRVVTALRKPAGVLMQPSRAGDTREILHAALTLRDPRQRWVTARRPAINPAFAIADAFWILGGRRDAAFLTYFNRRLPEFVGKAPQLHGAYGYRLRRQFGLDQLEQAYATLRKNPISRQVVLQIWDGRLDLPKNSGLPRSPDIPCNTHSILKVRNGRLEWLQVMRSNDAFRGLPYNLVQFTLLQEVMAGWLGLELGHYHHVCDSLHLYERDLSSHTGTRQLDAPETFALPRRESMRVISTTIAAIELVIDEKGNGPAALVSLARRSRLPAAYRSALSLVIADGLRRRGAPKQALEVMRDYCQGAVFHRMWHNWNARISLGA